MQTKALLSRPRTDIGVLLPVWKPGAEFVGLIKQLRSVGFAAVIVVDDGSGSAFASQFEAIADEPHLLVLRHDVNRGKGRALKTGFNHVLNCRPDLEGIVTADADGQHAVTDIAAVANALAACRGKPILGVRSFAHGVPLRSRIGNLITRYFFRVAIGARLKDTQTGLRGIPRERLAELLTLEGDRYEYETTMLAYLCLGGEMPVQVPIATVYIDGNKSSHFNVIRDSMRIYMALLRFCPLALGTYNIGGSLSFLRSRHKARLSPVASKR